METMSKITKFPKTLTKWSKMGRFVHSTTKSSPNKFDDMINKLKIKPAIGTQCFNGDIWEKLFAIHSAGFKGVEIALSDLKKVESLNDVYNYCSKLGLKVTGVQPFRNLGGWNCDEEFYAKIDELKKTFIIMNQLMTDKLVICSNVLPESSSDMHKIIKQFRTASHLADLRGIKLAYENVSKAKNVSTLEKICDIVEKVNEPNFGICLDSFHTHMHKSSLSKLPILKQKLFSVQLCDSPNIKADDLQFYARNYRVFPFQGNFDDLVEDIEIIHNTKFDGWLTLEVFNKFDCDSTKNLSRAEDGMRSLVYLQGKYSDHKFGTNYFPDLTINLIEMKNGDYSQESSIPVVTDISDITIVTEDLNQLQQTFDNLSYQDYLQENNIQLKKYDPKLEKNSIKELILQVKNQFHYNQWVFFLKACFKMEQLDDAGNLSSDIGLTRTQMFGYQGKSGLKVKVNVIDYDINVNQLSLSKL